jgi:hypothetical protein
MTGVAARGGRQMSLFEVRARGDRQHAILGS